MPPDPESSRLAVSAVYFAPSNAMRFTCAARSLTKYLGARPRPGQRLLDPYGQLDDFRLFDAERDHAIRIQEVGGVVEGSLTLRRG